MQIKQKDAALLTVEDIRALVRWCDDQTESWWRPESGDLTLSQILALYHAVDQAGYFSLDGWYSEDRGAALEVWHRIQDGVRS
jgi:hypothetical protein